MSTVTPDTGTAASPVPAAGGRRRRAPLSEGARADRRLAFWLIAPAVLGMIAVTGYPLVYAVILSLERYNLELPKDTKIIGFANYGAVRSSPYWWQSLLVTVIITVFAVGITLVLVMLLAQ